MFNMKLAMIFITFTVSTFTQTASARELQDFIMH